MAEEGQSDRMASDMEVCMKQRGGTEFFHDGKNGTHWYSLTLTERLWRPSSACEHSGVVGAAFQHW